MAARYAVAAGGNWSSTATWAEASNGAGPASVPTASDDVSLDAFSGNVTIDAASVCRSINCTGYTGTLTHTAAMILSIGDTIAGASNIALKFVAGMTYTLGSTTTSEINFVSTSVTVQDIDFAGKTTGNIKFNPASNGSWRYTGGQLTGANSTSVTLTSGTLNTNGQTCSWGQFLSTGTTTRSLSLGASAITLKNVFATIWDITNTGLTFDAGTSTITSTGALTTWKGAGFVYYGLAFTGEQLINISTTNLVCTNFTRTATASVIDTLQLSVNLTVTGTLTLSGNSAKNRLIVHSNTVGTPRVITISGATMAWQYVDLRDISLSGTYDASTITGGSGDCGGNTNITFTSATTQTWDGVLGGNWSANAWTTRVPLVQDTANLGKAFDASQTITQDMAKVGSINFTGATGSPTFALGRATEVYGNVILISGITFSGAHAVTFFGRGTHTLTSAGKSYPGNIELRPFAGSYTLLDHFVTVGTLTHTNGTFNADAFNVTYTTFSSANSNVRTLSMGSGTWTSTSTAETAIFTQSGSNQTQTANTASVVISGTSANLRTFAGGGKTYGSLIYTLAGSTGGLDITGSNTIGTPSFSDASNTRTLRFASGSLTRVTAFNVNGTAGLLMNINSTTVDTRHTLSCGEPTISCVYLNITNSSAEGGAGWFAGTDSVDGGNNLGWQFTGVVPPSEWKTFGDEGMSN